MCSSDLMLDGVYKAYNELQGHSATKDKLEETYNFLTGLIEEGRV